jgi:hypothetical protein
MKRKFYHPGLRSVHACPPGQQFELSSLSINKILIQAIKAVAHIPVAIADPPGQPYVF